MKAYEEKGSPVRAYYLIQEAWLNYFIGVVGQMGHVSIQDGDGGWVYVYWSLRQYAYDAYVYINNCIVIYGRLTDDFVDDISLCWDCFRVYNVQLQVYVWMGAEMAWWTHGSVL